MFRYFYILEEKNVKKNFSKITVNRKITGGVYSVK